MVLERDEAGGGIELPIGEAIAGDIGDGKFISAREHCAVAERERVNAGLGHFERDAVVHAQAGFGKVRVHRAMRAHGGLDALGGDRQCEGRTPKESPRAHLAGGGIDLAEAEHRADFHRHILGGELHVAALAFHAQRRGRVEARCGLGQRLLGVQRERVSFLDGLHEINGQRAAIHGPVFDIFSINLCNRLAVGQGDGEVGGFALEDVVVKPRGEFGDSRVEVNGGGGLSGQQNAPHLLGYFGLPTQRNFSIRTERALHGGFVSRAREWGAGEQLEFLSVAGDGGGEGADGGGRTGEFDLPPRIFFGDAWQEVEREIVLAGLLDDELVAIANAREAQAVGEFGVDHGQLALEKRERGGDGVGALHLERGGEGGGIVGEFAGVADFVNDHGPGFGRRGRRGRGV